MTERTRHEWEDLRAAAAFMSGDGGGHHGGAPAEN
ncbi:hypothetical protein M877_33455 [Streptomyces niveus NCIMB 11891]|nr:hypothetical protein M877_33455 [Streptomyces niveus NCIMB 11891]